SRSAAPRESTPGRSLRAAVATVLAVACGVLLVEAATPPPLVNYQGTLRDRTTGLPHGAPTDMTFTFYPDASSVGTDILHDAHAAVPVSGGLFDVLLGGGVVTDGAGPGTYATLAEVFRDFGEVWMEIQVGAETL